MPLSYSLTNLFFNWFYYIIVMGESAGGTMACLLGTAADKPEYDAGDNLEYNSSVQCVIDFYGITDMVENPCKAGGAVPQWAMEAFLGVNYTQEQARAASAIYQVSADTPPFMILHGTEDPLIPEGQSQRLYDVLRTKGIPTEYLVLEGAQTV